MSGLSLGVGGYGSAAASLPTAAGSPTGSNVNQAAFGIGTSQTAEGPRTAGLGTVGLGLVGTAVIVWLWYTLPR
jgi:hypothetical protein